MFRKNHHESSRKFGEHLEHLTHSPEVLSTGANCRNISEVRQRSFHKFHKFREVIHISWKFHDFLGSFLFKKISQAGIRKYFENFPQFF